MTRQPRRSTLFPYTTLFRSNAQGQAAPGLEEVRGAIEELRREVAELAERVDFVRSEEHTSELQSPDHLVCRLLLEKKKTLAGGKTWPDDAGGTGGDERPELG